MENNTLPNVDLRKTIDKLTESIEKCSERSNRIWHGVLRLIITLSSSLLLVTIALVERLFNSTIPGFLIYSWVLFFISIVFAIIAEINEVIFFSNLGLSDSIKKQKYEKLLFEGKTIPYYPEGGTGIIYNDILWGTISIDLFLLALVFMCTALLEKATPHISGYYILVAGAILIATINIYLMRKRKIG